MAGPRQRADLMEAPEQGLTGAPRTAAVRNAPGARADAGVRLARVEAQGQTARPRSKRRRSA
eukprot:8868165-Alexandrium_andersonii.AAC.1